MVRCFEDENITHVEGSINPLRDIEIIESELIFADIQQLEKKLDKLTRTAKADKSAKGALDLASELKAHLDELNQ